MLWTMEEEETGDGPVLADILKKRRRGNELVFYYFFHGIVKQAM